MADPVYHAVAREGDVPEGDVLHVEIEGREIGLYNIDGTHYAIDDICSHMRARLSDGYVKEDIIECPLHFGRFEIKTGKAVSAPCKVDIASYPVRVIDGSIEVGVDASEAA